MTAADSIAFILLSSLEGTRAISNGLQAHPIVRSTPGAKGGNGHHAVWLLGHLAFVEGAFRGMALGEANTREAWARTMGTGTVAVDDTSAYPTFDEAWQAYEAERKTTLAALASMSPEALAGKPKGAVPKGLEQAMATVAQLFSILALHNMVHYGQLADIRRQVGLKPLI
jgi:uncharacterized damage-inducible protein DinB